MTFGWFVPSSIGWVLLELLVKQITNFVFFPNCKSIKTLKHRAQFLINPIKSHWNSTIQQKNACSREQTSSAEKRASCHALPPTSCLTTDRLLRRARSAQAQCVAARCQPPPARPSGQCPRPAKLRLHEPPRLRGQRPAAKTRNNQPRAMQSCLERIKEEGGGAISVLRVDFRRGAVSVSKIGVVSAAAAVGNFGFAGFFRLSRSNKNE